MTPEDILVAVITVGCFAESLRWLARNYLQAMKEMDRELEKDKLRKAGKDAGEFEA